MQETKFLTATDISGYHLNELEVFQGLRHEHLEQLMSVCQMRFYEIGEVIVRAGCNQAWLYILLDGKVAVKHDGLEVTAVNQRGALFGESALLGTEPSMADVEAQTAATCLGIDAVLMNEVLCTTNMVFHAHFYRHVTTMLSNRLHAYSEELTLVKRAFEHLVQESSEHPIHPFKETKR